MVMLGLLLALGLVVLATRLKINMAHGLVAGCLVVALSAGMGPGAIARAIGGAWSEPKNVALALVVGQLMILSQILEKSGRMERLFNLVRNRISSPRLALVVFPALIGLLPMPGGAVFSAPMVGNAAKGCRLSADHQSVINYWFRHVWEYAWPLYPSVILISSLSGMPISRLSLFFAPLTLAAMVFGYLFILRKVEVKTYPPSEGPRPEGSILLLAAPIGVVILGALTGGPLLRAAAKAWPALGHLPGQSSMVIALAAALILAACQARDGRLLARMTFSKHTGSMLYLIAAIIAFQAMAAASGGVESLKGLMLDYHLPLAFLAILLPFITGAITGIAIGYVATSFPVLMGLIPADSMMLYLILAHAFGFAGVMLSPAHACLVLSNGYFEAASASVYRRLVPPLALVLVAAVILGLTVGRA